MKNAVRAVVGLIGVLALGWGLLLGLFTWDSSRIYPAYESAAKTLFKPITYPIEKAFTKAINGVEK